MTADYEESDDAAHRTKRKSPTMHFIRENSDSNQGKFQNLLKSGSAGRSIRNTFAGAMFFVASVCGWALYQSGSMMRIVPYLMGQRLFVYSIVDFGRVRCGTQATATIDVVNVGTKTISILGVRKSCGCIGLEDFPVRVKGGSIYPLSITITTPEKPSEFQHSLQMYISGEKRLLSHSITLIGTAIEK